MNYRKELEQDIWKNFNEIEQKLSLLKNTQKKIQAVNELDKVRKMFNLQPILE